MIMWNYLNKISLFWNTRCAHNIPHRSKSTHTRKKTINYVHWVPYGNLIQCIRRCRFYKFVILSMWAYVCVFYLSPNTHNICKSASSRCTIEMCNVSLAHIKLIHAALVFSFIQTEKISSICIPRASCVKIWFSCMLYAWHTRLKDASWSWAERCVYCERTHSCLSNYFQYVYLQEIQYII